jgi:hypothetical protein
MLTGMDGAANDACGSFEELRVLQYGGNSWSEVVFLLWQ